MQDALGSFELGSHTVYYRLAQGSVSNPSHAPPPDRELLPIWHHRQICDHKGTVRLKRRDLNGNMF